ncbi:MAG: hypoxanthine phosphoribosyltransferase [bacterium]|nr:hypoxanthine phosphoribosyltransferase [bacterium]
MTPPVREILIDRKRIDARIAELAEEIRSVYGGQPVVLVSILKGGFIFLADLCRALGMDVEIGFLALSSYQGETERQSKIQESNLALPDLTGRHVLIVEDILDRGPSLAHAIRRCQSENPQSLRTCVLLVKEGVERIEYPPVDFTGFTIPNVFVVGYGLDYRERYRQLPFIAVPELD